MDDNMKFYNEKYNTYGHEDPKNYTKEQIDAMSPDEFWARFNVNSRLDDPENIARMLEAEANMSIADKIKSRGGIPGILKGFASFFFGSIVYPLVMLLGCLTMAVKLFR